MTSEEYRALAIRLVFVLWAIMATMAGYSALAAESHDYRGWTTSIHPVQGGYEVRLHNRLLYGDPTPPQQITVAVGEVWVVLRVTHTRGSDEESGALPDIVDVLAVTPGWSPDVWQMLVEEDGDQVIQIRRFMGSEALGGTLHARWDVQATSGPSDPINGLSAANLAGAL